MPSAMANAICEARMKSIAVSGIAAAHSGRVDRGHSAQQDRRATRRRAKQRTREHSVGQSS